MNTCLITGALGFLGRCAVSEFTSAGYRVVGAGREYCPEDQVASLGLGGYHCMDLPSPELATLLAAEKPVVLVHTAGPASVARSMIDPESDFSGTVGVLFDLLEAVRLHSPATKVVILSSAAVYGNPALLPIAEDAALSPVSPYGFNKQIAETVMREFHTVYGMSTAVARVFSAYGAGLRRQILWDVSEKARTGRVQLFGSGDETRDFIHAEDVASAARVILEKAPMHGEAYNVASGMETSVREIAERVVADIAPGIPIEFTGVIREGDPLRWRADISALCALGFSPRVSLTDGVADYCKWYRRSGIAS